MALARLNISLSESMKMFIEDRMDGLGYTSVSEYFRELVRRDQQLAMKQFDEHFERQNARSIAPRQAHPSYPGGGAR